MAMEEINDDDTIVLSGVLICISCFQCTREDPKHIREVDDGVGGGWCGGSGGGAWNFVARLISNTCQLPLPLIVSVVDPCLSTS